MCIFIAIPLKEYLFSSVSVESMFQMGMPMPHSPEFKFGELLRYALWYLRVSDVIPVLVLKSFGGHF